MTGASETAKTLLSQLSLNAGLSADSNWVKARVALETGNRVEAVARLRRATRDDPNHPHAGPLLVKLTTSTGQPIPSFAAFRKLVEKDKPGHISSQIAYHAFRIGVGKESAKAKQALRELLGRERPLAKRQRAEIQRALGNQFLNTNHLGAAQDSFKNAIALQPDVFRFAEPLIKLHLAHYELDQARALLELYANLKEPRLHSYWAQLEALRGRASAALAHLAKAPSEDLMTRLLKGQMHLLRAQNLDGFVTPAAANQHLERAHEVFTALNNESKSMVSLTVSEFKDARIGLAVTETMKSSSKARALRRLEALRDGVGKDWGRQARGRVLTAYGQALTRAGRYKNARRQLNLAQQLIPEDFQVHWALCQLNDKLRRSRAAITQCRKALKNPFYEPARYRLASIASQYGDDPSVVFALQAMVESSAATDKATRRLIGSLARLERFDQIKKALARFKTNWSEASVAYANALLAEKAGRMNEAEKLYTQAKDAHPGEVDIVLDYARFMTSRSRRDLSLSALDALASTSSDVRVRLLSAKVAIEVGDFGRARRYAQTASKQTRNEHAAPESKASALALRGQAMLLSGNKRKHAAARRLIAKARLVDRNHPDVLLGMAFSAESRGQFSKAVASIQKLISLRPTEARGYYHLGRVLSRLLDSEGKAMEALEKARALDPDGLWGLRASSLLKRIKANARRR